MDPNEVLQQFMDLCNNPSGFSQYNLAPNTVLEWYGSTIRGKHKIYQYYRYDLCHQYEHHFVTAKQCDPIESKPSHSQTKQLPITDCNQLECGITRKYEKNCDSIDELTTPTRLHETPILPSLIQGRSFLSTNSDDLEDLGLSKINEAVTPPPKTSFPSNFGEPLPKKLKFSNDSGCEDLDNADYSKEPIARHSEKCINNCETHNTGKKDHNYTNLEADSSTKNNNVAINQQCSNITHKFSDLMYIETIGSLKALNKTKHRGVTGIQQHYTTTESQSSCSTSLESPQSYWDRGTKIRISYRIRLEDQQIQFFLIIYEHLTKKISTRRNLLLEFQDDNADDAKTPAKKPEPPEIKRKTPFKKNMRLF